MLKLACFAIAVAVVAGQGSNMMRYMMMQQMMGGGGGGGGGASAAPGGSGMSMPMGGMGGMGRGRSGASPMGGMMGMMNNPLLLCRQTENFQPMPCQHWRNICNIVSMRTYKFPNLMSCSPMGIGCCIKDAMSLMFVQRLG